MQSGKRLELLLVLMCAAMVVGFGSMIGRADRAATLGHHSLLLEVADDSDERAQGLSGTTSLAANKGMLFVFEQSDTSCFWMKDMQMDIDILWFDESRELVYQKRNVTPGSYPERFCPSQSAKYVVEVRAGTAERMGLHIGDKLKLL